MWDSPLWIGGQTAQNLFEQVGLICSLSKSKTTKNIFETAIETIVFKAKMIFSFFVKKKLDF